MARNDIIVRLRLAGEDFDREFKAKFSELEAAAEKQSTAAGSRSGSSFMKGFLGSAGIAGLGTAIGAAINSAANLGAEIASTSRQFNIGAEELQVWRQAASNAGVTAGQFDGALGSLTQKIGEANAGNRAAQQSFVELGLGFKTTAGEARATDAVMLDLAKRVTEIQDPSERLRVGTQLLGAEFKTLYPLLLDGADGLRVARDELGEFGAMLSQEEIQNLEKTNAKIEQMKSVLSIRIAGIVAENADAIMGFTERLFEFGGAAADAATKYALFTGALSSFERNVAALPDDLTIPQREAAIGRIAAQNEQQQGWRQFGMRYGPPGTGAALGILGGYVAPTAADLDQQSGFSHYTQWHRDEVRRALEPSRGERADDAAAPSLTGSGTRRGGGAQAARESAEAREARRAAEKALDAERKLTDQISKTLQEQEDSARIAQVRATQGELAAAMLETELNLMRQIPSLQAETVEELGKALGMTEDVVEKRRDELQLLIDQGKVIVANRVAETEVDTTAKLEREAKAQQDRNDRIAEQAAARWQFEHERAIFNVANLYETAMRGGVDDLWGYFKDEGLRMIAEVAAQWSLAMISGQDFNLGGAFGQAGGRSPLASIFMGSGAFGAANYNGGVGGIFGGGAADGGLGYIGRSSLIDGGGGLAGAAFRTTLGEEARAQRQLQNAGFSFAAGTIGTGLGTMLGGSGQLGQLGGMVGSIGGQALGGTIGALGAFGGPVGALLGGLLGSVLPGVLSGTKRGSVNIGNAGGMLGITGSRGNSSSREGTATAGANNLIDAIFQIADQLGGSVDPSRGSVSLGVRKDNFRVDTTGSGITKTRNGAIDFGQDQEAAIRFAIQDLIKDGVIVGISQASQNLLRSGGDLEAQIEKALMIEAVPRLLKERLDPLGAQLDELYDKFKMLADAMREGGASAEQVAEAQRLWELEKADAISSIGAASQTLADFLSSLNAGSNSPLSLREQRAEAERQLEPFLAQIGEAEAARAEVERLRASGASAADIEAAEIAARTAAAAIDQSGFTQASQLLLSISRQTNASSGAFFSDFDRIRDLTGSAIGFVDQATARGADGRDPFSQAIAKNTEDAAYILTDQRVLMQRQGETLQRIEALLGGGGGSGFTRQPRGFVAA